MRVTLLITAITLTALSTSGAQTITPDQLKPRGLVVGQQVDEYFGEGYTAISREPFVFFRDEPIAFRVHVRNVGAETTALVLQSLDPSRLFRVQGFKAPPVPYESKGERPRSADRYLDEVDYELPLVISPPSKRWAGGTFAIPTERETTIDPGDGVEWVVKFSSDNLQPGMYRFRLSLNGAERGGVPLTSPVIQIRFEVRPNGLDARPEILRREAERLLRKDDLNGARQVAEELLKVHPNSALAHGIVGRVAGREGKKEEAAARLAQEAEMKGGGRDELLLKFRRSDVVLH